MAHSGLSEATKVIQELQKRRKKLSWRDKLDIISLFTSTSNKGHKQIMDILLEE